MSGQLHVLNTHAVDRENALPQASHTVPRVSVPRGAGEAKGRGAPTHVQIDTPRVRARHAETGQCCGGTGRASALPMRSDQAAPLPRAHAVRAAARRAHRPCRRGRGGGGGSAGGSSGGGGGISAARCHRVRRQGLTSLRLALAADAAHARRERAARRLHRHARVAVLIAHGIASHVQPRGGPAGRWHDARQQAVAQDECVALVSMRRLAV